MSGFGAALILWAKRNRPLLIMALTAALGGSAIATPAWADLTYRDKDNKVVASKPGASCGGGGGAPAGAVMQYSVTDKAGNVFTQSCVDGNYLNGELSVPGVPIATPLGRCVFPAGANQLKFETKADNSFESIEWVNVKPNAKVSQKMILDAIQTTNDESTADWLKKVNKFLKDNGLTGPANSRIYMLSFSPLDQQIGFFSDSGIVINETLTPSEAQTAYEPNGNSPIADLQIDPAMRVLGAPMQVDAPAVPEPTTWILMASGVFGLLCCRWLAQRPNWSPT
jgi:hypothetical protein